MNDSNGRVQIKKAGTQTTLQDSGRVGFQHLGITPGGYADRHAASWANALLGNQENSPLLEITLGQCELYFEHDSVICVTGAECDVLINNRPMTLWCSQKIQAGEILRFGFPYTGVFNYLSIARGFSSPNVLNSCASVIREKLGPNNGAALKKNDWLKFTKNQSTSFSKSALRFASRYRPDYASHLELNLIPGFDWENVEEKEAFLQQEYTIAQNTNKMGTRLNGMPIAFTEESRKKREAYSEGVSLGTVQIPENGQPIILGAEHQTIGGYPKVGCISKLSYYQLAQRRPGQSVSFSLVSRDQAQRQWLRFLRFFSSI